MIVVEAGSRQTPSSGARQVVSSGDYLAAVQDIGMALNGELSSLRIFVDADSIWDRAIRATLAGLPGEFVRRIRTDLAGWLEEHGVRITHALPPSVAQQHGGAVKRAYRNGERPSLSAALLAAELDEPQICRWPLLPSTEVLVLCSIAQGIRSDLQPFLDGLLDEWARGGILWAAHVRKYPGSALQLVTYLVARKYLPEALQALGLGALPASVTSSLRVLPAPQLLRFRPLWDRIAPSLVPAISALRDASESAEAFARRASGLLSTELDAYVVLAVGGGPPPDLNLARAVFQQIPHAWDQLAEVPLRREYSTLMDYYRDAHPTSLRDWVRLFQEAYLTAGGANASDLATFDHRFGHYVVNQYRDIVASGDAMYAPEWVHQHYVAHQRDSDGVLILVVVDGLTVADSMSIMHELEQRTKWPGDLALHVEEEAIGLAAIPTITQIGSRAIVYGATLEGVDSNVKEPSLFISRFPNGVCTRVNSADDIADLLRQERHEYCIIYRPIDSTTHIMHVGSSEISVMARSVYQQLLDRLAEAINNVPWIRQQFANVRLLLVTDHGKREIPTTLIEPRSAEFQRQFNAKPDHRRILRFDPSAYNVHDVRSVVEPDWAVLTPSDTFLPQGQAYLVPLHPKRTETGSPLAVHGGLSLPEALVPLIRLAIGPAQMKDLSVAYGPMNGLELAEGVATTICLYVGNPNNCTLEHLLVSIPELGVDRHVISSLPPSNGNPYCADIQVTPRRVGKISVSGIIEFTWAGKPQTTRFGTGDAIDIRSTRPGRNLLDDLFDSLP